MQDLSHVEIDELHRSIEREHAALEVVIEHLRREQDQLKSSHIDALDEINRDKARGLGELEYARATRIACMQKAGLPRDSVQVDFALNTFPTLAAAWRRLRDAVRTAAAFNALNGKLVAIRLQSVSSRLEILRGADANDAVYAADGRTGAASSGRVIAAA